MTRIVLPKCWPLQIKHQWNWRWYFSPRWLRHSPKKINLHWNARPKPLHNPMFWNKECLSGFPLNFLYNSMATSHKHSQTPLWLLFSGRAILPVLPDPWLLLQGGFAVRQQLLSDCVDSDGHDPPAKATDAVILLEITTWSSSTLSGLNTTLD